MSCLRPKSCLLKYLLTLLCDISSARLPTQLNACIKPVLDNQRKEYGKTWFHSQPNTQTHINRNKRNFRGINSRTSILKVTSICFVVLDDTKSSEWHGCCFVTKHYTLEQAGCIRFMSNLHKMIRNQKRPRVNTGQMEKLDTTIKPRSFLLLSWKIISQDW